jgi:hypothetical protein
MELKKLNSWAWTGLIWALKGTLIIVTFLMVYKRRGIYLPSE